jgi:hypothetical protein
MLGEVEPLKELQDEQTRTRVIERILSKYPSLIVEPKQLFYRIRKGPATAAEVFEYDSPPDSCIGNGRLDARNLPVLYASPDLQVCIHECRVTAEDELYVATLTPNAPLRFLQLTSLLEEDNVTEFESLDMAVHMLFLAGKHSYPISRDIAQTARAAGFHGIIYPSYFSLLRLGAMPFQTVYGISHRRIPQYQEHEESQAIPNLAIFGRPIKEGKVSVRAINKLIISRASYDFHFGPVAF